MSDEGHSVKHLKKQQEFLVEYLREQYVQARQHATRQSTATSFLTAAAAVVLGLAVKNGEIGSGSLWAGISIVLVGIANFWINRAHFLGNRFHTTLAGEVRKAIESSMGVWKGDTPSQLREKAKRKRGISGPDSSVGQIVYNAIQWVPIGVVLIGIAVSVIAINSKCECLSPRCLRLCFLE